MGESSRIAQLLGRKLKDDRGKLGTEALAGRSHDRFGGVARVEEARVDLALPLAIARMPRKARERAGLVRLDQEPKLGWDLLAERFEVPRR